MVGNSTPPEKFEDILDLCLTAIESGQATLEQCLASFPAHAAELEPLLRAAQKLRQLEHPEMASERVDALERVIVARARELPSRRVSRSRSRDVKLSRGLRRLAFALSIVLSLVLVTGVGAVAASGSSLPGELLYGVKRAAEDAQLSLASEDRKPELLAELAEERVEEVEQLANNGEVPLEVVEGMLESTNQALNALESTSEVQQAELAAKLTSLTERQQDVLAESIEKAPPQAQQGLQRALEASQHGHERAVQAQSGEKQTGPPDDAGPPDGKGPPVETEETGAPDATEDSPGSEDESLESPEPEEESSESSEESPGPGKGKGKKAGDDEPDDAQGNGQGGGQGNGQGGGQGNGKGKGNN